jgi:phosphoglycerate dehydrogenase-like enzyme
MHVLIGVYSQFRSWSIRDAHVDWLRATFPQHTFVRADTDADMLSAVGDAEVAFSSRINAEHFAAACRLRWIHSLAAGVGSMLFPALVNSDVVLTNSRGNTAPMIAEHVIAVVLSLLRDLPRAHRRQQERRWALDEFEEATSIRTLRGSRVLIVGLGSIGADTAQLAAAFGAEVTGIRRRPEAPRPPGVTAVFGPEHLRDQLAMADVVVIAAPQTAETVHLIGARELAAMKPGAVLVNVSRGKLVDDTALIAALDAGTLRGAALDVFEHEPLAADSPLWSREDVLITPHVAGYHEHYWRDALALFAENLRRYEAGHALINVVDKRAGY